jgi:hypothetical protein
MKTYSEYIAENLNNNINYSDYFISEKEQKQELRKKKMKNILSSDIMNMSDEEYDLSDVTDMYDMLNNCPSLSAIGDIHFSVEASGLTNMTEIFNKCSSLTSIDDVHFSVEASGSTCANVVSSLEENEINTLIDKIKKNINEK